MTAKPTRRGWLYGGVAAVAAVTGLGGAVWHRVRVPLLCQAL